MKGVKFNKEKMKLRQDSVRYIRHLLTADGLKADPEKVKAVVNMPKPTNVKEVQRLVGFVNYLAKFLPQLSTVYEPLRKLVCKDNKWMWESQQEEAFNMTLSQSRLKKKVWPFALNVINLTSTSMDEEKLRLKLTTSLR